MNLYRCTECGNAVIVGGKPRECPCGGLSGVAGGPNPFEKVDPEDLR